MTNTSDHSTGNTTKNTDITTDTTIAQYSPSSNSVPTRLCYDSLHNSSLPNTIKTPAYIPEHHKTGIVHIGIGNFHKSHQAVFVDDILTKQGGDWRITAVSLRSALARDNLDPQDCLYTVNEKSTELEPTFRIIGALENVLVAPENPSKVVHLLAQTAIKIVTLTITEKGYCYNSAKQELDINHKHIVHDIANPNQPKTMAGFLVAACALRKQNKVEGFTIISCDNLSHNGRVTQSVVMQLAQKHSDNTLPDWIQKHVRFCNSMVDCITPKTTDKDIKEISEYIGLIDKAPVICEPFRQWVIEDNFCNKYNERNERPAWEDVGVLLVADVTPYETMKLRLLNGSHSALAYLGVLCGYDYIHEAIENKILENVIINLMDKEVTPTLTIPKSFDIEQYKQSIRQRFANRAVPYKTTQVASDGSQKIPQRLLATAEDLIHNKQLCDTIILVIAAWMRYLQGENEQGHVYVIDDPKAEVLKTAACKSTITPSQAYNLAKLRVASIIECSGIFPSSLAHNDYFINELETHLSGIIEFGTLSWLQKRFT